MPKTVLFQTVQSRISIQFSSIWPIDGTLSGATTPGQSGTGSDGAEGVLRIPQSSSITGTSPSDCLVSYLGHSLGEVLPLYREAIGVLYSPSWLGHSLGESYLSAEKQSVYCTAPADWIMIWRYFVVNFICSITVLMNNILSDTEKFLTYKVNDLELWDLYVFRSKDELIRDVLQWTPTHGRASISRPAKTYQQQICEHTGCSLEDRPRAMDDKDG